MVKPSFRLWNQLLPLALMCIGMLCPLRAFAVDYSLTGFGTVQYTIGSNEATYLRFADDEGTLKVNSVVGGQLDVQLNPELRATVQYVLAPKRGNDNGVELDNRWAFLEWQPTDAWAFRVGRQRIHFYLDSDNLDVGQTYVMANLAPELYFNAAVMGIDGVSAKYSFTDSKHRYWSISALSGQRQSEQRTSGSSTTDFPTNRFDLQGVVVQVDGENYRAHVAHLQTDISGERFRRVGPFSLSAVSNLHGHFSHMGLEWRHLAHTLRAEVSLTELQGVVNITPSIVPPQVIAKTHEWAGALTYIQNLNDRLAVYGSTASVISQDDHQYSVAVGARWRLNAKQSIKGELMRVYEKDPAPKISDNRALPDEFNLLSISYNWVW